MADHSQQHLTFPALQVNASKCFFCIPFFPRKDGSSSPRARFGIAVLSALRGDWQTALDSFREAGSASIRLQLELWIYEILWSTCWSTCIAHALKWVCFFTGITPTICCSLLVIVGQYFQERNPWKWLKTACIVGPPQWVRGLSPFESSGPKLMLGHRSSFEWDLVRFFTTGSPCMYVTREGGHVWACSFWPQPTRRIEFRKVVTTGSGLVYIVFV